MDDEGDDYYEEESAELYAGDGGGGGGISLAGVWWDNKALEIAEEVILSFDGHLKIYAFKTLPNFTIQVQIEKLWNRSGSPSMEDIEAFSRTFRARLDEAELAKSLTENLSLEVCFYSLSLSNGDGDNGRGVPATVIQEKKRIARVVVV